MLNRQAEGLGAQPLNPSKETTGRVHSHYAGVGVGMGTEFHWISRIAIPTTPLA